MRLSRSEPRRAPKHLRTEARTPRPSTYREAGYLAVLTALGAILLVFGVQVTGADTIFDALGPGDPTTPTTGVTDDRPSPETAPSDAHATVDVEGGPDQVPAG